MATKPSSLIELLAFASSLLVSFACLGWVLWRCKYGIDFTDESFYLVWMANPWIYGYSASQFGFIYHPLYVLVGGDIVLLRQSCIFITFLLAWALCWVMIHKAFQKNFDGEGRTHLFIFFSLPLILASCVLFLSSFYLVTPSYNTLALQALLIAATGMLLAERQFTPASFLGWFLIGLGGWLAFMAKPTTALALSIVVLIYLIAGRKFSIYFLLFSAFTAVALLLVTALVLDGSIHGFIDRLSNGVAAGKLLIGEDTFSTLLRIDDFFLESEQQTCLAAGSLLIMISTYLSFSIQPNKRLTAFLFSILLSLWSLLIISGFYGLKIAPLMFQGLQLWAVPIGVSLATFLKFCNKLTTIFTRQAISFALCFAVFPHVYAFGTGGNYWYSGSSAAIFWVLSGISLIAFLRLPGLSPSNLLPAATYAQATVIVLLYMGMENPYRQPQPLRLNKQEVGFGPSGAKLILADDIATYVTGLHKIAFEGGFKEGTPVIDMTGNYPGSLYSIGAKSIGQAWMLGGYKGTAKLAAYALDRVSCRDIGSAWLLLELGGSGMLPPEILKRYGAGLLSDYVPVGELASPTNSSANRHKHQFLKPLRTPTNAQLACEHARQSGL